MAKSVCSDIYVDRILDEQKALSDKGEKNVVPPWQMYSTPLVKWKLRNVRTLRVNGTAMSCQMTSKYNVIHAQIH